MSNVNNDLQGSDIHRSDKHKSDLHKSNLHENLANYRDLMRQGLFRDALDAAQQQYGPYESWREAELSLLSARCLTHLGMDRTGDAIIYHAWRRQPDHAELAAAYLAVVHRRQGAVIAWNTSQRLLQLPLSDRNKANLLCEQADITASFRDFSQSEKIIQQAKTLSAEPWVRHIEAYLLFSQDRYDESYALLEKILQQHENYRPGKQLLAHILVIRGKINDAITVLADIAKTMQSVSLLRQLLYLHLDLKEFEKAEQYMNQLETIYYRKNTYTTRQFNYVKADVLCSQERYEEALPYLEEKDFFHRKLSESIKTNTDSAERRVLDVPFVRQHHMTCAPASISAIISYWGTHFEQADIVREICYDGTPDVEERQWISEKGWLGIEFVLEFDTLKALIDKGIPVLLSTVEPGSAHLQIIVGYDKKLGLYFLRDPYHPRLQELLVEASHKHYASSGPRCMLVMPEDKLHLLQGIKLKDKELYDENYQLNKALRENNRELASAAAQRMSDIDADNSLSIKARRRIALHDDNEPLILKLTEKLLARYPDDVNYQMSKAASLSYMSTYQHVLDYLESLYRKPFAHYLIKSRLARELVRDHRQQKRSEKLLHSLIRHYSTETNTLKVYADYLWSQSRHRESYDIYRFLTCLEDKSEHYASSYFKAARYFKETDQALEFLIDRYHRYKDKSNGPVISLFHALNTLDRTREGFVYLDQSIKERPEDGALLLFAARQYFYINDNIRSKCLLELARPLTHKSHHAEMAAEVSEFQQDREAAIEHWRTVLDYEPLSDSANSAYVRLLSEMGQSDKVNQFIEQQLLQFPNNYLLLKLKLRWCCDNNPEKEEAIYRHLMLNHQDDNWAHKELARLLIQQFRHTEAIAVATEATGVKNDNADAYCVLGLAYQAKTEYTLATENFRQAIKISCDCTEAYEPLLNCVKTTELKRQQLQFIYDELIAQVTFGDALLEFQRIASNWYTADELLTFLKMAVEERPDLWQSWSALAIKNRDLGDFNQAHKLIDQAIENFPLIPRLYYEKAEIYFYMNELENMQLLLKQTLQFSPDWTMVVNRLSEILEYQNKIPEAIDLLQKQIQKTPFTFSSYGYLADLLCRNGNQHEAIDTLFKVIELSPTYYWAWSRLAELCDEVTQAEEIQTPEIRTRETQTPEIQTPEIQTPEIQTREIQTEKKQTGKTQKEKLDQSFQFYRKQLPDDVDLTRAHAKTIVSAEHRQQLYIEFLQRHPHAIDLVVDYIQFLVHLGKYDEALSLCEEQRWNNDIPIEIQANFAWILYNKGNTTRGISEMSKVVEIDQNYYDGWRFLVNWYDKLKDSDNVIRCLTHCQRLYPNDANVLCYVAEKLEKHAPDDNEKISKLLEQAYYLDPTDSYNGLTYIDKLLDNKNFTEAEKVLTLLKELNNNEFVTGRELSFYCRQQKKQQALECWQRLITDTQTGDNLIGYAWNQLKAVKWADSASDMISAQRIKSNESAAEQINDFTGEYWAYHQVAKKDISYLQKQLKKITIQDDFDSRVYEGYLRSLIDDRKNIPESLFKKNYQQLHDDLINWKLVLHIKAVHDEDNTIINWMKDNLQREGLEPSNLYYYMLALRKQENWTESAQIVDVALDMPRDNYFDELLVWSTFDQILQNNKPLSLTELAEYVDIDNLSGTSKYIHSLIEALDSLNQRSFNEAYTDISPRLRYSQKMFNPVSSYNSMNNAKRKVHNHLKQTLTVSSLNGLLWKWRLSNHF